MHIPLSSETPVNSGNSLIEKDLGIRPAIRLPRAGMNMSKI